MSAKRKSMQDLLDLFSDLVSPEDVIYAKLSAEISALLSKERIKRHMTQSEFAAFLDVKQSQVSKWEHGVENISLKTISKLAAKLELNLSINAVTYSTIRSIDSFTPPTTGKTLTRTITLPVQSYKYRTINDAYRGEMTKVC